MGFLEDFFDGMSDRPDRLLPPKFGPDGVSQITMEGSGIRMEATLGVDAPGSWWFSGLFSFGFIDADSRGESGADGSRVYSWRQPRMPGTDVPLCPLRLSPAVQLASDEEYPHIPGATQRGGHERLYEGFRHGTCRAAGSGEEIPVLVAAVSAARLFSVFMSMSDFSGPVADLVLETSHDSMSTTGHRDLVREQMDLPVLQSVLWDCETLLCDDGHTGVAIVNQDLLLELQLDTHKLICIYGHDVTPFERILAEFGIPQNEDLVVVTERSHRHGTSSAFCEEFERLARRVGAEEFR